ncbi:helix-turn-helix transcriptional regulator [Polycladidibacter stylochi]|uniref:helix-turn-helix transcriptional regulator n=1 Tax=Polycladidibacter stylochi TaxID=1807766 RepID=UPI00083382C5|nr:response regulator transcription factor [Pseudovibrio stylochi]
MYLNTIDIRGQSDGLNREFFLIADIHPTFASALAGMITSCKPGACVLTTTQFTRLQEWSQQYPRATVLVNPRLSDAPGLMTVKRLNEGALQKKIFIILDEHNKGLSEFFIEHGAQSAFSKTEEVNLIKRLVVQGNVPLASNEQQEDETEASFSIDFYRGLASLTRRQATILNFLKCGKLNKQIAHELGISEATVKHHVSALLSSLGFYSRSQLVAMINELSICIDSQYVRRSKVKTVAKELSSSTNDVVAKSSQFATHTDVYAMAG